MRHFEQARLLQSLCVLGFLWAQASSAQQARALPKKTLAQQQGIKNPYENEARPSVPMMDGAYSPSLAAAQQTPPSSQPAVPPAPKQLRGSSPPPSPVLVSNSERLSPPPAPAQAMPVATVRADNSPEVLVEDFEARESHPHWNVGLTYTYSRWNQIAQNGEPNGSLGFELGIARELAQGWELGMSALAFQPSSASADDEVFAFQLSFDARWYMTSGPLRPFLGLSGAFGVYRVWSTIAEDNASITYAKSASGILVGLVPTVGFKLQISHSTAFELAGRYLGYFDNPANKVGGWTLFAGLSFGH